MAWSVSFSVSYGDPPHTISAEDGESIVLPSPSTTTKVVDGEDSTITAYFNGVPNYGGTNYKAEYVAVSYSTTYQFSHWVDQYGSTRQAGQSVVYNQNNIKMTAVYTTSTEYTYLGNGLTNSSKRDDDTVVNKFAIIGRANGGDADTSLIASKTSVTRYIHSSWACDELGITIVKTQNSSFSYTSNTKYTELNFNPGFNSVLSDSYENNILSQLPIPNHSDVLLETSTFTITGKANGGIADTSLTATKKKLATNFKFQGWNSASDGSGTTYDSDTAFTESTTVYAMWDSGEIVYEYENNALSQLPIPSHKNETFGYDIYYNNIPDPYNDTTTATVTYSFNGWYSSANNYGTPAYSDDTTFTESTAVYAGWTGYPNYSTITIPTASKENYVLLGWDDSSEANNIVYYVGDTVTVKGNMNLYAVWGLLGAAKIYNINTNSFENYTICIYDKNNNIWITYVLKKFNGTDWDSFA